MSDNNSPLYSSSAYTSGYGSNQQTLDKPRHGATIEISDRGYGVVHLDQSGSVTTPLLRSYSDGIRVGCTFVTNEVLKKIYNLHQRYLTKEDCVTHQDGK